MKTWEKSINYQGNIAKEEGNAEVLCTEVDPLLPPATASIETIAWFIFNPQCQPQGFRLWQQHFISLVSSHNLHPRARFKRIEYGGIPIPSHSLWTFAWPVTVLTLLVIVQLFLSATSFLTNLFYFRKTFLAAVSPTPWLSDWLCKVCRWHNSRLANSSYHAPVEYLLQLLMMLRNPPAPLWRWRRAYWGKQLH